MAKNHWSNKKVFFFISMLNYMYTRIDMVRYCTICGNTVLNMVNCHLQYALDLNISMRGFKNVEALIHKVHQNKVIVVLNKINVFCIYWF